MATRLLIDKDKLDNLATAINTKAGATGAMTIQQMQDAVTKIGGQWNGLRKTPQIQT